MSLKDRLNNQNKTIVQIEKQKKDPKYYQTSEISQGIDSLGEIDTLFADDEINSIFVIGAKNIYVERNGKKNKIPITYRDNVRLENIIRKNAQFHGIKFDETHPYIEFCHKLGVNVSATLPPLSNVATMIVKCYKDKYANLKTLTQSNSLSKEMALIIEALSSLKLNIVIAGKKNTLKTSLLSAMAKNVPQNNNAILFDYSNELKSENENIAAYDLREYKNDDLIDYIFSANPDKIFINDCKDFSYFEKYLNDGYKGICITCKAREPIDVLNKIDSKNIDVIIFTERKDTKRLISSISVVKGSELENIFYLNEFQEHNSSGIVPDFYQNIESKLSVSSAIFEADYKHTYHKVQTDDAQNPVLKKNLNMDILKKFKKDLDIGNGEEKENASEKIGEAIEESIQTDNEENLQLVQEQENNEQNI